MVILFDSANPSFDDLITPDESHIAQTIINPSGGVIAIFLDPCLYVVTVRVKQAFSIAGLWWFKCQVRVLNIPLNCVAADTQAMPKFYQQHDILIAPTVREGFGLAIAEAMACGLPVVASDCSAIPELIDDGMGGFLCPVGDVKAFADKINLLADSPKLRHEMGEYTRAKVEKMFTLDRMVKEYQDLFQEVLG
jgi:glycosyltransferase involved in cell wall biosynthesis